MYFLPAVSQTQTSSAGARSGGRVLYVFSRGVMVVPLRLGGRSQESRILGQPAHEVEALDALAGAALDQVVDRRENDRGPAFGGHADVDEVRPLHVVHVRRSLAQTDEALARIGLLEDLEQLVGAGLLLQGDVAGREDAAHERRRVGLEEHLDPRGLLDLGSVAEGGHLLVGEVRLPARVVWLLVWGAVR